MAATKQNGHEAAQNRNSLSEVFDRGEQYTFVFYEVDINGQNETAIAKIDRVKVFVKYGHLNGTFAIGDAVVGRIADIGDTHLEAVAHQRYSDQ